MKPYCEDCKTNHDKHQAHIWPKAKKVEVFRALSKPGAVPKPEVKEPSKKPAMRLAGFDKVAYQEGYMRFWRALKGGRACRWPRVVV